MSDQQVNRSPTRPLFIGFGALFLLVFGVGFWSVRTTISGAVIINGVVQSNNFIVQHPEGGVVKELLVTEGDTVVAGDVLLRFDDYFVTAEIAIIRRQLVEISAQDSRLAAQRDNAPKIQYQDWLRTTDDAIVRAIIMQQDDQYHAHQAVRSYETSLLSERTRQIEQQISNAEDQLNSISEQQQLVADELVDMEVLMGSGLTYASKVRTLQREAARLQGLLAGASAIIVDRRGVLAELNINNLRLQDQRREAAIAELIELQRRGAELRKNQQTLQEILRRTEVRTPVDGTVFNLQNHASGTVLVGAVALMSVAVNDSRFAIIGRIPPTHIDQISVGQVADLRFTSLDERSAPVVQGNISIISPDVIFDEGDRVWYYSVEILLVPDTLPFQLSKLRSGMPVLIYVQTDDHSPIEYFLNPLTEYFSKAFRE